MAIAPADIHKQLATAAKAGRLPAMRKLLRKGARPDVGPCCALWEAVSGGEVDALACLIEAKPNQEALDEALHFATMSVHREMVRMLLDAGARVTFDVDADDLFEWPKKFGDTKRPEEVRRILVAHMTAIRLRDAMDSGNPEEGESSNSARPSDPSLL